MELDYADNVKAKSIIESDASTAVIIGYREDKEDSKNRRENLMAVINFYLKKYGDLFKIYVIEQDSQLKLSQSDFDERVCHHFLYNPAITTVVGVIMLLQKILLMKIIILADSDILPGSELLEEVNACFNEYEAVSPYRSVFYTSKSQRAQIVKSNSVPNLKITKRNSVTQFLFQVVFLL